MYRGLTLTGQPFPVQGLGDLEVWRSDQPTTACDCDGPLIDTYLGFQRWWQDFGRRPGYPATLPKVASWKSFRLEYVLKSGPKFAGQMMDEFYRFLAGLLDQPDRLAYYLPAPLDGMTMLQMLVNRRNVAVVSGNPFDRLGVMAAVLHYHYPKMIGAVALTDTFPDSAPPADFNTGPDSRHDKAGAMAAFRTNVMVEDRADVAITLARAGIHVVLVGIYRWSHIEPQIWATLGPKVQQHIHRVHHLIEVPPAVLALPIY